MGDSWRKRCDEIWYLWDLEQTCKSWFIAGPYEIIDYLDADADLLNDRSSKLAGMDKGSSMATNYEETSQGILRGQADLDKYWRGFAADQYINKFLPSLQAHIGNLKEQASSHSSAADAIATAIETKQNSVYGKLSAAAWRARWINFIVAGAALAAGGVTANPLVAGGAAFYAAYEMRKEITDLMREALSECKQLATEFENTHVPAINRLGKIRSPVQKEGMALDSNTGLSLDQLDKQDWQPDEGAG